MEDKTVNTSSTLDSLGLFEPSWRTKNLAEARELARQHTALASETLVNIMQHGDKDAAWVAAAQALLDRGWGKAVRRWT